MYSLGTLYIYLHYCIYYTVSEFVSLFPPLEWELLQSYFFFFFNKFIYFYFIYFIFGCLGSSLLSVGFPYLGRAGATLCCGAWASHCGGFSCCGARALGVRASVVVAHGLQGPGSVVVAQGLRCFVACAVFLGQGSNPCPLHWQVDS